MSPEKLMQENYFSGKYSKNVFLTLKSAYQDYKWLLAIAVLFGLLGRILLLSNANIIGIWVDTFCKNSNYVQCRPVPEIFKNLSNEKFVMLMSGITLLGFTFTLFFRIFFSVLSAKAVSQIYDETTLRTSRFPMSFFDTHPAGRIVTRFSSDYGNVFRLFGGPLAEFLSIIFDLASMILLVSFSNIIYFPILAIIAAVNFYVYKQNQQKLRQSRRMLSASRSPSIAHFSETAQGASTIRSFNRQKTFSDRFENLDLFFLKQKKNVLFNITTFSLKMNFTTALLLLVTGLISYLLIEKGIASVGSLGVAFSFIALSGTTVQMFFDWLAQFEEAMIGVERLDNYLRMPLELGAKLPMYAKFDTNHWQEQSEENLFNQNIPTHVEVEFKNIYFRYLANQDFILKNLSFKIIPGERIGIIGKTGSGKSSIIQALLYLYPIEKGEVSIDGKTPALNSNQQGISIEQYRQYVSYISQDSILFKGTLRDNLAIDSKISDVNLNNALVQVGLEEWANTNGLSMAIEEKGKNLSLGEKQLVCMARCLLQETPLVIMDEATSSVDPRSEEIMVKATHEIFAGKTQIIIAHRLSTLQKCDRILWLEAGEIKMFDETEKVLQQFKSSRQKITGLNPDPTNK